MFPLFQSLCSAPFIVIHCGFFVPWQTLDFCATAFMACILHYSVIEAPASFISVLRTHPAVSHPSGSPLKLPFE